MEQSVEEEDRISSLPDCLVVEILSRLPSTKCAIRTGVLSKQWQHLWTFLHTLIFQMNDINVSMEIISPLPNFLSYISKTITQCQSKKLNKFCLHTSYHVGFESQLNHFIRYAINRNVQELYLKLGKLENSSNKFELKDDTFFNNSCFTRLNLARCVFRPSGVISWNNLKSLCVSHVELLDEALIQNILSGSPLLETLSLDCCYGHRRLDITSKSVKNLVVSGCYGIYDLDVGDIFEINAPNVLSLTIKDSLYMRKLLLLDVSSLLKASLNYWKGNYEKENEEMLQGLILKLRHVKELKVGKLCLKAFFRLEASGFKFPSNLKVLVSPQVAD